MRVSGITLVPVLAGSNDGSPVGTAMSNRCPVPVFDRSISWSMNWPQAYTMADIIRSFVPVTPV